MKKRPDYKKGFEEQLKKVDELVARLAAAEDMFQKEVDCRNADAEAHFNERSRLAKKIEENESLNRIRLAGLSNLNNGLLDQMARERMAANLAEQNRPASVSLAHYLVVASILVFAFAMSIGINRRLVANSTNNAEELLSKLAINQVYQSSFPWEKARGFNVCQDAWYEDQATIRALKKKLRKDKTALAIYGRYKIVFSTDASKSAAHTWDDRTENPVEYEEVNPEPTEEQRRFGLGKHKDSGVRDVTQ